MSRLLYVAAALFMFVGGVWVGIDLSPEPEIVEVIIEVEKEKTYYDVPLEPYLQDYIRNLTDAYEYTDMELVLAIMKLESNFKKDIISKTNDYGLMQINEVNHDWLEDNLGLDDILDPLQNIFAGVYIIEQHLAETDGDIELALMMYNKGVNGAKSYWSRGVYSIPYSEIILKYYEEYKQG